MKKEKLYKGKLFELNAYYMQVEHRKVRREIIEHPGAAAMLAFDEKGKVLLVKQHRFPHGYILEIPAGTLEKGEDPIDCAYREIIEETGYKAKKMTKLVSYFPSNFSMFYLHMICIYFKQFSFVQFFFFHF